jgi:hypothetical protein
MTNHRYPALLVAAIAATFVGAAVAQTQSDDTSRMPANKGMAQESQTQPSTPATEKITGQDQMKSDQSAKTDNSAPDKSAMQDQKAKPDKHAGDHAAMADHQAKHSKHAHDQTAMADHKAMKHGAKSKGQTSDEGAPDQKAYRDALRDCAKQQDQGQRDSCLDTAIEKFHRNA